MEIKLSPDVAAIVHLAMSSGRYGSVEEYVAEAVELLHERQAWPGESLDRLQSRLQAAWQESDRGELMDEDEVRREMQAMKAEFLARKPVA